MDTIHVTKEEKRTRTYFLGSVLLKGAISLAEMLAALVALIIPVSMLTEWTLYCVRLVLPLPLLAIAEPRIVSAGAALSLVGGGLIAFYLFTRGFIKLALIVAMLKQYVFAYPWSLVVLAAFVIYQIYELVHTHSLGILAVTLFDLVVMWFIWKEWRIVVAHTAPQQASVHTP